MARGWIIPPPKRPIKSSEELERERVEKVKWLIERGYLTSARIRQARDIKTNVICEVLYVSLRGVYGG